MSQQQRLAQTINSAYKASQQVDNACSRVRDAVASFIGDQQEAWRRPHGFMITLRNGQQQDIRQYMRVHTLTASGVEGGINALDYLQLPGVSPWDALKGPYRALMFPNLQSSKSLDNKLSHYAGLATAQMALSLHRLGPSSADSLFDKLQACSITGYVPNDWLVALLPLVEEHFGTDFQASTIKGKPSHRVFALKLRQMTPRIGLLPTVASAVEQFGRLSSNNKTGKSLEAIVSRLCVSSKVRLLADSECMLQEGQAAAAALLHTLCALVPSLQHRIMLAIHPLM